MFTCAVPVELRRLLGILSSRGVGLVVQLSLLVAVGHGLGVAGLGVYQVFVSWSTIIGSLGAFGAPMQNLRDVALAAARGDQPAARRAHRRSLRSALVGVVLLAAVLMSFAPWLHERLVPLAGTPRLLLAAAAAAVFFAILKTTVEAAKGMGYAKAAVFLESGFVAAFLLAVIAGFAGTRTELSVDGLIAAHVAALAVASVLAAALWMRARPPAAPPDRRRGVPARDSRLAFGATQSLGILSGNLAIGLMPVFFEAEAIGLYAAAQRFVGLAAVILATSSAYFAPRFAREFAAANAAGLDQQLRASQLCSLALFAPVFLVLVICPRFVLQLVGPGFGEAALLLVILASGQLLNAATGLAGYFLSMVHKERADLACLVVALLHYVVLLLILAPSMGVTGIAISAAVFTGMRNVGSWLLCRATLLDLRAAWHTGRGA